MGYTGYCFRGLLSGKIRGHAADNAKLQTFRPKAQSKGLEFVVPAKAGTHASQPYQAWIPAFAH